MEAGSSPETLQTIYKLTLCYNRYDLKIHQQLCRNLKPHTTLNVEHIMYSSQVQHICTVSLPNVSTLCLVTIRPYIMCVCVGFLMNYHYYHYYYCSRTVQILTFEVYTMHSVRKLKLQQIQIKHNLFPSLNRQTNTCTLLIFYLLKLI